MAWSTFFPRDVEFQARARPARPARRGGASRRGGLLREKVPFNGKQSQIAERKTVGEQGPGNHGKEAAEQNLRRRAARRRAAAS